MVNPHYPKILISLSFILIAVLACSSPDSPGVDSPTSTAEHNEETLAAAAATRTPTHAPTQQLRPTRQQGQLELPKPNIPAPPASSTRQPAQSLLLDEQPDPQQPAGQSGTFYVVNDTSLLTICYFYMALSSDSEWGPDQLGGEVVISPGEYYAIDDMLFGHYDVQALDCSGELLAELYGFDFPPNDTFTLFDQ